MDRPRSRVADPGAFARVRVHRLRGMRVPLGRPCVSGRGCPAHPCLESPSYPAGSSVHTGAQGVFPPCPPGQRKRHLLRGAATGLTFLEGEFRGSVTSFKDFASLPLLATPAPRTCESVCPRCCRPLSPRARLCRQRGEPLFPAGCFLVLSEVQRLRRHFRAICEFPGPGPPL